jgi:hypothetical protein
VRRYQGQVGWKASFDQYLRNWNALRRIKLAGVSGLGKLGFHEHGKDVRSGVAAKVTTIRVGKAWF